MVNKLLQVKEALVALHREEAGQDLIEYVLIAALIALAAIIGMNFLASAINNAFKSIGSRLQTNVS